MDAMDKALELIDLLICPGFCVENNKIIQVNDAARRSFLEVGTNLDSILVTGQEEYLNFQEGCLYLTVRLAGDIQGATVTRLGSVDIFLLDEQTELRELQVLALAAQELRMPLSNVILSADELAQAHKSPEDQVSAGRLARGTAQLQRLVSNMSDALRYVKGGQFQLRNITSLLAEQFERAQVLSQKAGISLTYEGPQEDIFTLLDPEQLERAVYNLISNALKFTPKGGHISAQLKKKGKLLQLTVQDSGSGIADRILKNIFTRYLRQPSLEDSRFGLGLGMVLIRTAARNHGGTVLIDRPPEGARISMTLAIRENQGTILRSPVLTVDYAGERDHGLLELSESLPADLYLS